MRATSAAARRTPVTALAFVRGHAGGHSELLLLAAAGPRLLLLDTRSGATLLRHSVLPGCRIHGVVVGEQDDKYLIAVHGGRQVCILQLDLSAAQPAIRTISPPRAFPDWVKDVWLSPFRQYVAVGLAHNSVSIHTLDFSREIARAQSDENCILYAGRFAGDSMDNLTFAAGTVWNEILVWRVPASGDSRIREKRLRGHEGVVFSVRFDREAKRLASVSDDRTVRVWDLVGDAPHIALYGHWSRVWDAQFAGDSRVVSVSEDATARVWDLDTRQCVSVLQGHVGKNVWSMALSDSRILATGGGDSAVRLWDIERQSQDGELDSFSFELPEELSLGEDDYIRDFSMCDQTRLVCVTRHGLFFKYDTKTRASSPFLRDADFASYCMMSHDVTGRRIVVAGSMTGQLLLLDPDGDIEPLKLAVRESRIFDLFIHDSPDAFRVFTTGAFGDLLLSSFTHSTDTARYTHTYTTRLHVPRDKIITHAALVADSHIVVTCADSSIIVFPSADVSAAEIKPRLMITRAHAGAFVSYVADAQRIEPAAFSFVTVGRDGAVADWTVSPYGGESTATPDKSEFSVVDFDITLPAQYHVERTSFTRISRGHLEKITIVNGHRLITGTLKSRMFLHDCTKNAAVLSLDWCGHRRWAHDIRDASLWRASFALIVERRVIVHSVKRERALDATSLLTELIAPIHGREIHAVKFLDAFRDDQSCIFVTGGEDAWIQFQKYTHNNQQITPLVTVKTHTSTVRAIDAVVTQDATLLFTAGGKEELYAWHVSRSKDGKLACMRLATLPHSAGVGDTRIMAITALEWDGAVIVAVGYSDAKLMVWRFSEQTFTLVASSPFYTRCVLAVEHFLVAGAVYVATASTDGRLVIWSLPDISAPQWAPILVVPAVHQSGINAISIRVSHDASEATIASVGDDNALVVTRLYISADTARVVSTARADSACASLITGVKFTSPDTLVIVSVDQKLASWRISGGLERAESVAIDIAAVAGLDVVCGTAVVVGQGIEVFDL